MGQLTDMQIRDGEPREKRFSLADRYGSYLRVRQTREVWLYR